MDIKMLYVEAYAREHKTFSFRKLLEKQNSKMEVIVTFPDHSGTDEDRQDQHQPGKYIR